jgi:hypothetical protein
MCLALGTSARAGMGENEAAFPCPLERNQFTVASEIVPNGAPASRRRDPAHGGLVALCRLPPMYGYEFTGTRCDLGDRFGFIAAQIGFSLKRSDFADWLRAYLRSVISA